MSIFFPQSEESIAAYTVVAVRPGIVKSICAAVSIHFLFISVGRNITLRNPAFPGDIPFAVGVAAHIPSGKGAAAFRKRVCGESKFLTEFGLYAINASAAAVCRK